MNYLQEGASCHYSGFASCGCAPDLTCKHYNDEELRVGHPRQRRGVAYRPGGLTFCLSKWQILHKNNDSKFSNDLYGCKFTFQYSVGFMVFQWFYFWTLACCLVKRYTFYTLQRFIVCHSVSLHYLQAIPYVSHHNKWDLPTYQQIRTLSDRMIAYHKIITRALKNTNPLKLISSDNKTFDVISCLRHKFFRYQLMLLFKLISLILRISSWILTILPQLMRRSFCHRSDST